jgi:hypothetical protein
VGEDLKFKGSVSLYRLVAVYCCGYVLCTAVSIFCTAVGTSTHLSAFFLRPVHENGMNIHEKSYTKCVRLNTFVYTCGNSQKKNAKMCPQCVVLCTRTRSSAQGTG